MWSKQDSDWKPPMDGTETKLHCGMSGQQIRPSEEKDLLTYHCLNRWDEDPFETALKNKSEAVDWLDKFDATCPNEEYLYCMGQNPGQCIGYECKFLILIAFSCQFAWHYTPFFKNKTFK